MNADLALLELEEYIDNPIIELAVSENNLEQNDNIATVIGWGALSEDSSEYPEELRHVNLPIVSNEICNESFEFGINDNMLCAGYTEGGKDACQGDSGGPFVTFDQQSQIWKQIGIVSFGDGCARPNSYGVYTRVSKFTKYIKENITCIDTPNINLIVSSNNIIIHWNEIKNIDGYKLFYAPSPIGTPIRSIDMGKQTLISASLPFGSSYFVAVQAYNKKCVSKTSNIEHFLVSTY
jgi:hypothetical protein